MFTSKGHRGFENSFHIMQHDEDLLSSLKYVIDYCILCVKKVASETLPYNTKMNPQVVYDILAENFFKIYY